MGRAVLSQRWTWDFGEGEEFGEEGGVGKNTFGGLHGRWVGSQSRFGMDWVLIIVRRDPQQTARLLNSQVSNLNVVDVSAFLLTVRHERFIAVTDVSRETLRRSFPSYPQTGP